MKRSIFPAFVVLLLAAIALADDLQEFQPLMKAGAGAVGVVSKALDAGDTAAAQASAAEAAEHFEAMAAWWNKKGAADARGFAMDIVAKAEEVYKLTGDGDIDGAKAQLGMLRGNCKSCHTAHRTKAADGSWRIQ